MVNGRATPGRTLTNSTGKNRRNFCTSGAKIGRVKIRSYVVLCYGAGLQEPLRSVPELCSPNTLCTKRKPYMGQFLNDSSRTAEKPGGMGMPHTICVDLGFPRIQGRGVARGLGPIPPIFLFSESSDWAFLPRPRSKQCPTLIGSAQFFKDMSLLPQSCTCGSVMASKRDTRKFPCPPTKI